ncbi:unnamed protein product [Schistosoma curassoni]|uniref:Uncharacterized protein n=1 Tax=Schistosoma curassoni TaxID=6186 RepID=A0A183KWG4_9TREM|nr:unnamed protein product [Schistosoma curassoni]
MVNQNYQSSTKKARQSPIFKNQRRAERFKVLLSRPASPDPQDLDAAHINLPIDVTPSTIEGMRMTIRHIENDKSEGPDNIPAEAMKSDTEVIANMLHVLLRKIWE